MLQHKCKRVARPPSPRPLGEGEPFAVSVTEMSQDPRLSVVLSVPNQIYFEGVQDETQNMLKRDVKTALKISIWLNLGLLVGLIFSLGEPAKGSTRAADGREGGRSTGTGTDGFRAAGRADRVGNPAIPLGPACVHQ